MHSFEVHSNESACRKKVRFGLEQVSVGIHNTSKHTHRGGYIQRVDVVNNADNLILPCISMVFLPGFCFKHQNLITVVPPLKTGSVRIGVYVLTLVHLRRSLNDMLI